MNLMTDIHPFQNGLYQLSVIHTDLTEAESLVKQLAEEEKRRDPQMFAGKEACVYFKMPYIPPCDPFKELRRLILRIHGCTGLRANFKGVVAIEVSEWIGHEREEYFTVLLKYLYDHRGFWRIAAVLNHCTEDQVNRFLSACTRYITPRLFDANLFSDRDTLGCLIRLEYAKQGKSITQEAVEQMAEALGSPALRDARSLTLIERSVEETVTLAENSKPVTLEVVREYLTDPDSTLTMMAGKMLVDERSILLENEALQLRGGLETVRVPSSDLWVRYGGTA